MKYLPSLCVCAPILSHPSRGAWIEIQLNRMDYIPYAVAPLAGCVD